MVIDLNRQRLRVGRSTYLGASAFNNFADYIKSGIKEIASDKDVRVRVVSEAIQSVTGVAPIVDTKDPNVTWIRTVPAHGEFVDALFLKSAKQITSGPSKGMSANVKIDIVPAIQKLVLFRFLPAALIVGAGIYFIGYHVGRK